MAAEHTGDDFKRIASKLGVFCLLVFALTSYAFHPSIKTNFTFDDVAQVQHLNPSSGYVDWISSAFEPWWPAEKQKFVWRPVARMFILAEKSELFFPNSAAEFHLISLGLHTMTCASVFLLALYFGARLPVAAFIGLILAVHPLRSEAVCQIVGQTELLAAIFMSVGLMQRRPPLGATYPPIDIVIQSVIFALALGSKEHAILYPAYLLLLNSRPAADAGARRRKILLFAALAAVAIVWLLARRWVTGGIIEPRGSVPDYENVLSRHGFLSRLPAALGLFGYFLSRVVLPFGLSPDYSAESLPIGKGWLWPHAWLGLAALILMLAFIRHDRARGGQAWRPLAAFLLSYAFISNLFFTHGTVFALRLLYWPMTLGALTVASLPLFGRWRKLADAGVGTKMPGAVAGQWRMLLGRASLLGLLVVLLLALQTSRFSTAWRSDLDFASATAAQFPQCWRAHHNLAREYYLLKDFESGYEHAAIATTLRPEAAKSWDFRGLNAMFIEARGPDAETSFLQAVTLDPSLALPHQHLSNLMRMLGRNNEADEYRKRYLELSRRDQRPDDADDL